MNKRHNVRAETDGRTDVGMTLSAVSHGKAPRRSDRRSGVRDNTACPAVPPAHYSTFIESEM